MIYLSPKHVYKLMISKKVGKMSHASPLNTKVEDQPSLCWKGKCRKMLGYGNPLATKSIQLPIELVRMTD